MARKPVLKVWVNHNISETGAKIVAHYSAVNAIFILKQILDSRLTKREFDVFYHLFTPEELITSHLTKGICFDRPAVYTLLMGRYCCLHLGTKED